MAILTKHFEGTAVLNEIWGRINFDYTSQIYRVDLAARQGSGPTGADMKVDICKGAAGSEVEQSCNGGSLIVLADGILRQSTVLSSPISFSSAEDFSLKFKQIGSTLAGEAIEATIYYKPSAEAGFTGRTFEQIRDHITQWLRSVATLGAATEMKTAVDRIINQVFLQIITEIPRALRKTGRLETEAIYETGSLTATTGSRTFTGHGTTWLAGHSGWHIIITGEEVPYEVTWVSATEFTAAKEYVGDGGSGLSYKLIKIENDLAGDCCKILNMHRIDNDTNVAVVSLGRFRKDVGTPHDFSDPTKATVLPNGALIFDYLTEDASLYEYDYEAQYAELINDSDVPSLREDLHYLIELGAKAEAESLDVDIPASEVLRAKNVFEHELDRKSGQYGDMETEDVCVYNDL